MLAGLADGRADELRAGAGPSPGVPRGGASVNGDLEVLTEWHIQLVTGACRFIVDLLHEHFVRAVRPALLRALARQGLCEAGSS